MQGACVVLSGRADRSFVTHRGSTAEFCREDIDVPRLLDSNHVHVGRKVVGVWDCFFMRLCSSCFGIMRRSLLFYHCNIDPTLIHQLQASFPRKTEVKF